MRLDKFIVESGLATRTEISKAAKNGSITVNGEVVAEKDYFLGDTIQLPADPTMASDEEYQYTFVGWTPSPTVAAGEDRNPVYEAVFSKSPVSGEDPFDAGVNNNGLFTKTIPIACACLVVLVGVIVFLRVRARKKKKLRAQAEATVGEAE